MFQQKEENYVGKKIILQKESKFVFWTLLGK